MVLLSVELMVIMNGQERLSWDEGESATTIPFEKELLHYKVRLRIRSPSISAQPRLTGTC